MCKKNYPFTQLRYLTNETTTNGELTNLYCHVCYFMYAMLVLRGPQGRLVIPTESPSLNKVFTYLLYLLDIVTGLS